MIILEQIRKNLVSAIRVESITRYLVLYERGALTRAPIQGIAQCP